MYFEKREHLLALSVLKQRSSYRCFNSASGQARARIQMMSSSSKSCSRVFVGLGVDCKRVCAKTCTEVQCALKYVLKWRVCQKVCANCKEAQKGTIVDNNKGSIPCCTASRYRIIKIRKQFAIHLL